MQKKPPPVIDGQFRIVDEGPVKEPIINSWPALWWFVIPPCGWIAVRYAQIKGWL